MTIKQEKFVQEYVKDFNATQAALRAGFSAHTARNQGSALLARPDILGLINAKRQEILQKAAEDDEKNWMSHENIAKGFRDLYHRCMEGEMVMTWDARQKKMVPLIDEEGRTVYQFDSAGANRAWENIAKHVGFYELDNSQKTPVIQVNIQQNNFYGPGEGEAGNNSELTDSSLFTVLPPPSEE